MDEDERRKKREYMRRYRERNRERTQEYQREYNARYMQNPEHAEAARERAREYYTLNREQILDRQRAERERQPTVPRPRAELHHGWKGDAAGYSAIHKWVGREFGTPSRCDHCGTEEAGRYDWANVDHEYSRRREDWMRLCPSCHRRYDYQHGFAKLPGA